MQASQEIEDRLDGQLIKVLDVVGDGDAFFGRLANGSTARFSFGTVVDLQRGDIILVGEDRWFRAPDTVWPDDSTVGVVRKILDDSVVLEAGAGIRTLKGVPAIAIEVGNTVEFNEIDGIVRVISETPLRYRDAGIDEDLHEYVIDVGEGGLTFNSFGGYGPVVERAKELIETQLDRKSELDSIGAQPVKGVIFTGPLGQERPT